MLLLERERELASLADRARDARSGKGSMVLVCGEPGAGKTTFVDAFIERLAEQLCERGDAIRTLVATCDPLATPRPLGPLRDIAGRLGPGVEAALQESEHPYEIFGAACADLTAMPTVLVIDDLHWADQGTIDMLRFVLRRVGTAPLLVVGALRDEELDLSHPGRALLGDVARSPVADTCRLAPLSLAAIQTLVDDRGIDPAWLHRVTGGNPFFVVEMLDHSGDDELPLTIRDAVLARTAGLGVGAWDLLHLLAAAPESIPDQLLTGLGVGLPALRELNTAGLVRRSSRGLAFRHDLCRLAVATAIPPGATPALHRRMLDALESSTAADAAVLAEHAVGAGDTARVVRYAGQAGLAAARSGAHTQAAQFLRLALDQPGDHLSPAQRADLLLRLAAESYLIDDLDQAVDAAAEAVAQQSAAGDVLTTGTGHTALAIYEWYNADRPAAEAHIDRAVEMLGAAEGDDPAIPVALGHALAIRGFLALHASALDRATPDLALARELARATGDRWLQARVGIVDGVRAVLAGDLEGRAQVLSVLADAPKHLDEMHSSGYSNLSYVDIEQRRFGEAAALLDRSLPLMVENDLPICRVWQVASRGRLAMMTGAWDAALADAENVLSRRCAPLARMWPHIVRGLVTLRRGDELGDDLEQAWELAVLYGEPLRLLAAATALAEQSWLTGAPDERADRWADLILDVPVTGLEWARGELALWLRRLGVTVDVVDVAAPYAAALAGDAQRAQHEFQRVRLAYDAALTPFDGDLEPEAARQALQTLDRLGADAVAAKLRQQLRAAGQAVVPAPRAATRANPLGLTARQMEVLSALSDGSTNAELAARLFVSEKTVDHHVSAILTKLGVANRREAARRARELGVVP